MSQPIIEVENLSKLYHFGEVRPKSLKQAAESWWHKVNGTKLPETQYAQGRDFDESQRGPKPNTFWSLKNVSFKINEGEVVGIIGRNGAGKSTLLKILSRITEPTAGRAVLRGRVASLLEVGTGFHPDLTGHENVYLNGAILGMRKIEIDKKLDEIVAFAEVEKFIDTPVKHYSSGMYVRLAFAVAAHLDPEILLVDEVLAVGDVGFQEKCLGKMKDVATKGRTVLFVSHNLSAVRQLTQRCMVLDKGHLKSRTETSAAISDYLKNLERFKVLKEDLSDYPRPYHEFSQEVFFVKAQTVDAAGDLFNFKKPLIFRFKIRAKNEVKTLRISMTINSVDGHAVGSFFSPTILAPKKGEEATYQIKIYDHQLAPGKYRGSAAVGQGNSQERMREFDLVKDVLNFEVGGAGNGVFDYWSSGWGAIRFEKTEISKEGG